MISQSEKTNPIQTQYKPNQSQSPSAIRNIYPPLADEIRGICRKADSSLVARGAARLEGEQMTKLSVGQVLRMGPISSISFFTATLFTFAAAFILALTLSCKSPGWRALSIISSKVIFPAS